MKRLLPLVLLLACTTAHPVMMPSGQRGWYIKCRREAGCFRKAERVCPGGYHIVRDRPTVSVVATGTEERIVVQEYPGATLLIECGRRVDDDE